MTRRKTQQEWLHDAHAVHGDRYEYTFTSYTGNKNKVVITCREHGNFEQTASKHLGGQGCPRCSGKYTTTESSIARANKVHGSKYDYSKYLYIDCYTPTIVICPMAGHGEWLVSHNEHVNGKSGCPTCAGKRVTTETFKIAADELHHGLYTYENVEYITNSTKVNVTCKKHGSFWLRPSDHLLGGGCPKCTKQGGYNTSKQGYFYVMFSEDTTKIGISNKHPSTRARQISQSAGKTFSIVTYIKFSDGLIAKTLEATLLRELRCSHRQPEEVYDGSTECFLDVDYDDLLLRVVQLCSEFLPAK